MFLKITLNGNSEYVLELQAKLLKIFLKSFQKYALNREISSK